MLTLAWPFVRFMVPLAKFSSFIWPTSASAFIFILLSFQRYRVHFLSRNAAYLACNVRYSKCYNIPRYQRTSGSLISCQARSRAITQAGADYEWSVIRNLPHAAASAFAIATHTTLSCCGFCADNCGSEFTKLPCYLTIAMIHAMKTAGRDM